jgi:hypothetical protein
MTIAILIAAAVMLILFEALRELRKIKHKFKFIFIYSLMHKF